MRVVVTATDFADIAIEAAILEDAGFEVVATDARSPDEIVTAARDAEIVMVQLARIDGETIDALEDLRFISRYGAGVDNIDLEAARRCGIAVANVPEYGADEVALHATSLLLALVRHLAGFDLAVREGRWHHEVTGPVRSTAEMTLGVLGLGRIGTTVVDRAGPWFRDVVAHDVAPPDTTDVELVGLDELFDRADAVSIHVPLTDDTRGVVDRARLARLGPGGYLVNTARGPIVRIDDLAAALDAGDVAGAALDVLPDEPPPADHSLLRDPRVLLTPHVGWYSAAAERDLREQAARNIVRWSRGRGTNLVVT